MLSDPTDFAALLAKNASRFPNFLSGVAEQPDTFEAGDIYCPGCGGPRRLRLWAASPSRVQLPYLPHQVPAQPIGIDASDTSFEAVAKQLAPCVVRGVCLQDETVFTFVLFEGPESSFQLAVFPNKRGGLSTLHTPASVSYYLDQAQRAQSAAANSAAVAMYRAALEHLLFEQGFTERMLGPKIKALEKAITDQTAPRWALSLDIAYLQVIGKLGNAVIHPGDGDIARQEAVDRELLTLLEVTFTELLRVVYEREHEESANLDALNAALTALG